MNKMLLWKVSIAKKGKKKIFKELYFIGEYLIQVSHNAEFLINGNVENDIPPMFNFETEITSINKVMEVDDIINAHNTHDDGDEFENEPSSDQPYILAENSNYPQNRVICFKHDCEKEQRVADYSWDMILCRDCHKQIFRKDLSFINGIWLYNPS